jgi:hypothetical protein
VFLKLDEGALHFDVQICGEAATDLKRGKRTGFNERAASGLERLFQIPAKLAMHVSLHSLVRLPAKGQIPQVQQEMLTMRNWASMGVAWNASIMRRSRVPQPSDACAS